MAFLVIQGIVDLQVTLDTVVQESVVILDTVALGYQATLDTAGSQATLDIVGSQATLDIVGSQATLVTAVLV